MKKIILTLLAAIAALSVDAQVIEVKRGTAVEAIYGSDVKVNFRAKKELATYAGITNVDNTTNGSCGRKKTSGDAGYDEQNPSYESQDWVQLWEGGPKFAVNVVNNNSSKRFTFWGTNATDPVTEAWGPNWRTPTLTELATMIAMCQVEYSSATGTTPAVVKISSSIEPEDPKVELYGTLTGNEYNSPLWTSNCLSDGTTTKRFGLNFTYTHNSEPSETDEYDYIITGYGDTQTCYILAVLNE